MKPPPYRGQAISRSLSGKSRSSMRTGSRRWRWPVAWKMALQMAAATPTMLTSPSPLTPTGFSRGSGFVDEVDLDGADVGIDGYGLCLGVRGDESAAARIY